MAGIFVFVSCGARKNSGVLKQYSGPPTRRRKPLVEGMEGFAAIEFDATARTLCDFRAHADDLKANYRGRRAKA